MRFSACVIMSLAVAAGCASGPPTSRATVEALLSTYEAGPSADAWRAMPGDVPAILSSIANDPSELPTRRGRALEVLGWFEPARSVPILSAVLRNESTLAILRVGAISGLTRALPRDRLVPALAPALNDPATSVRFRAAVALRQLDSVDARLALQARRTEETSANVLRVLKQTN